MSLRYLAVLLLSPLLAAGCARSTRTPATPAQHEIADLYARFSAAANDHDWDAMAALFADDASWQASAGALGFRHEGRAAIRAWLLGNRDKIEVLIYLPAAPSVELLTAERARAQASMSELLSLKPSSEVKQLFGVYHDELQRRGERWLFTSRRFELRKEVTLASTAEASRE